MKESTINSLLEWAKKEGAMLDMIDVRYCGEDRGFGVFARRMIRVHEVFLRIPKHLMITAGLVAEMPAYKEILERHRLEAFPILVLFFYLEAKNLQNSFFKPYFMSLPKSFDTPLAYNNSTVEENIKMDQLPNRAKELLIKQQNEFTYIREQLSRALDNTNLDMDHLNWAWHVVNTRCVYSENPEHPLVENAKLTDTLAIIPVMDMLNHSPNAQGLAYLDKKSDFYCVNAEYKCVNEGDEIFVCYGAHDNIRLWVEYGFSIPHNIFNRVDVPNGVLFALAETLGLDVSDEKKRIIEEMAIPNTMYLSDIKPSFGIQKNIAILLMDKLQLKDVKTLVYGSMQNEEAEDTIYLFLEALKGLLEKRVKTCSTAFSHFWTEQVEILNNIIKLREDSSDDE